jgi:hypothetical protein
MELLVPSVCLLFLRCACSLKSTVQVNKPQVTNSSKWSSEDCRNYNTCRALPLRVRVRVRRTTVEPRDLRGDADCIQERTRHGHNVVDPCDWFLEPCDESRSM